MSITSATFVADNAHLIAVVADERTRLPIGFKHLVVVILLRLLVVAVLLVHARHIQRIGMFKLLAHIVDEILVRVALALLIATHQAGGLDKLDFRYNKTVHNYVVSKIRGQLLYVAYSSVVS